MPKATPLICNFNAGELDPKVDVRSDINKYYNGCRTLLGFIPLVEGGATRVPGTYFLIATKDSTKQSRLFPFHFSTTQGYQLEFGEYYIRFYKNKGQIVIDTSMLDFNPASSFFTGEYTKIGDYIALNAGGGAKYLYVAAPYDQANSHLVKVGIETNGADILSVTAVVETITIKLANATPAKNSAILIQTALRAIGTLTIPAEPFDLTVDLTQWTVTENAAYAAARPTAGINIAAVVLTLGNLLYQCLQKITVADYSSKARVLRIQSGWNPGAGGPITLKVEVESNTIDTMVVSGAGDTITIKLANSTTWKNSAILIQLAIRLLGTVNGVDVSQFTVTENSYYSGDRPTTGIDIPPTLMTLVGSYYNYYEIMLTCSSATNNTNYFPTGHSDYWHLVTLGDPVEIITPYDDVDLFQIKRKPQVADTFYIFHKLYPAAKLIRHSHINWEYVAIDFKAADGSRQTITGITKANPAVVTTNANHGLATGDKVYLSGILGMTELNGREFTITVVLGTTFQLDGEDSTYYTAYSSAGVAQKVKSVFNSVGEYPGCGVLFEQRLGIAGFENYPYRINMSTVSDFENFFENPNENDAAIEFTLVSDVVDNIRWMAAEDYMVVGTIGGAWRIGGASIAEPITATSINTKKNIFLGSADVDPQMVIDSLLWLTEGATSVRQLVWSIDQEKYTAPDMTRVARHIAMGPTAALSGIKEMAFQKKPMPILWCVRNDGVLLGMTYEIQEQVYAWFRVITDGLVESVSVISASGAEDEVWIIVNRTIGGITKRYIEYFTPQNFYSILADAFFVHSGLTSTIVAADHVHAPHLANEAVDVMIAGVYIGRITADGTGEVKFSTPYSGKCHVGLPFTSILEPMKLHAGSQLGTARGKKQMINRLTCCFYETVGGKYGMDSSKLYSIVYTDTDALKTEDIDAPFAGDWKDEATICIVQDQPYPMTVLALVPHVGLNEE